MIKKLTNKELAEGIRVWISVPENYSVVHYAIEAGISKEELMRRGSEDDELGEALEYAMSVQEYKVVEGAMRGELDRNVVMKMLDTYSGWKGGVVNIDNRRVDMSGEVAERLIEAIGKVRGIELRGSDQVGDE